VIASKRLIESTCRDGGDRALTPHPLPWLQEILNGVEFANFFEQRATEYSKAATRGRWDGDDQGQTPFIFSDRFESSD